MLIILFVGKSLLKYNRYFCLSNRQKPQISETRTLTLREPNNTPKSLNTIYNPVLIYKAADTTEEVHSPKMKTTSPDRVQRN